MKLKVDADLFLFDLDGTVYLGDTPIPGAMETLGKLSAMGKKVCFLTNNSSKDKRAPRLSLIIYYGKEIL